VTAATTKIRTARHHGVPSSNRGMNATPCMTVAAWTSGPARGRTTRTWTAGWEAFGLVARNDRHGFLLRSAAVDDGQAVRDRRTTTTIASVRLPPSVTTASSTTRRMSATTLDTRLSPMATWPPCAAVPVTRTW